MPLYAYRCSDCAPRVRDSCRASTRPPSSPRAAARMSSVSLSMIARPAAGGDTGRAPCAAMTRRYALSEFVPRWPGSVTSAAKLLKARRIVVPANGIEFEVFEAGAGDRLALLLHGFPQHAVMWRASRRDRSPRPDIAFGRSISAAMGHDAPRGDGRLCPRGADSRRRRIDRRRQSRLGLACRP